FKKAAAAIRTELKTLINARRVALAEGKATSSQDLLSHLLTSSDEDGKYLTEMEIANNILLLLFAGHDTSTCSITLLMKRLAEHPAVYDKVLKEQLDICKTKEAGELLKWEDIQKMKYSWNVVSEVMRLNPPIIGAFKEALEDFEYGGYTIPKGWKLYWSAAATQKDEASDGAKICRLVTLQRLNYTTTYIYGLILKYNCGWAMAHPTSNVAPSLDEANFEDVERFDPSRFEVLVYLHNIVTNFKWDLLISDEKIEYDPMPVPEKGLPIRLHPHQL
ncbi:beta-amyrin 28-oxidase-like protein, partial [Tanacetum coccineum]